MLYVPGDSAGTGCFNVSEIPFRASKITQWAKCLPFKHEDLSSNPDTHINSRALQHISVTPVQSGKSRQVTARAHWPISLADRRTSGSF